MSEVIGKMLYCDMCSAEVFVQGKVEISRNLERKIIYDALPEGWLDSYRLPEGLRHLCPKCAAKWKKIEDNFVSKSKRVVSTAAEPKTEETKSGWELSNDTLRINGIDVNRFVFNLQNAPIRSIDGKWSPFDE